jgi:hypothetical protein
MPTLRIFIDGEQRHEFDLSTIDGISANQQPSRMHEMPVYRSILRLNNGSTYTFYSSKWEDVNKAGLKLMGAKQKGEDVSLDFQSAVNPKYTVTYAPEEESGPHLVVYVGDHKLFSTSIEEITEKGAAYNRDEPCSITIAYRNPDPYVDGAEDDPRENDIRYTIIVDSEQMVAKNEELYDIVDGRKEGPIYFDAALNPELLPK